MRALIPLITCLFWSFSTFGVCTDFSGTYHYVETEQGEQGEQGEEDFDNLFIFQQTGCEKLEMIQKDATSTKSATFIADGKFREYVHEGGGKFIASYFFYDGKFVGVFVEDVEDLDHQDLLTFTKKPGGDIAWNTRYCGTSDTCHYIQRGFKLINK